MKYFSIIFVFVLMLTFSISFAQTNWTKHEDNPVFRPGSSGEWDEQKVGLSSVIFDGSSYHMWYSIGNSKNIGYASSTDGITWIKYDDPSTPNPPFAESDPVLSLGTEGSWDDERVSQPCVIMIDTVYHMWYKGTDNPDPNTGAIGHATSTNGITWEKDENNPVLDVGPSGSWDHVWLDDPWVLFDGSVYHMWYHAWNGIGNQVQIGHATSPHPDSAWTKDPKNPVLEFENGKWDYPRVLAPCIIYDGNTFHMWYSGGQTGEYRIGYATSQDGSIPWTKAEADPVLEVGSAGNWDDTVVGFCSVIDSAGSMFKMWYTGANSAGDVAVGYATAPLSIVRVPDHYATIQEAIDASSDGNTVLVDEGTYYENINFKGKAITVASHFWFDGDTSHISKTIIDGSRPADPDSGSVVYFISGEDTTSVLCGFTITGGLGTYDSAIDARGGGGIFIWDSGSKILHNNISGNSLSSQKVSHGSGLLFGAVSTPENIIIAYNKVSNNSIHSPTICGGAVYLGLRNTVYCEVKNNNISYNSTNCTGRYKAIAGGLGISMNLPTAGNVIIDNNKITYNELHCQASIGAGIYVVYWDPEEQFTDLVPTPVILNNIIAHNYSQDRGAGIGIWTVQKNNTANPTSKDYPQPAIINNTIVNNKANDGCGIFNFDSYPLLMNNILWNDLSVEGSREIFNDDITYPDYTQTNEGELNIYYSDIQGGREGEGNINADPFFEDSLFHLSDSSWCVGNGISSIEINGNWYSCPNSDYFGNPRPNLAADTCIDMGAIESSYPWVPIPPDNIKEDDLNLPLKFALYQNYPNPFNPVTVISYQLPVISEIELSIFNILGQKVVTLVNAKQPAGNYNVEWHASGFASGVYLYKLKAGDYIETKKMIYMK